MKNILSSKNLTHLLLALTLLAVTSFAFAEETTSTGTAPVDHTKMKMDTPQIREAVAERTAAKEERRVALTTRLQERIVNLSENVTKRLTAGTERMDNITLRLETRIEKLKALNVDTAATEAKLTEAKDALEKTKDALADFGSVQVAVGSDTPKTAFAAIRTQFKDAHALLRTTHSLLRETVALLKEAVAASDLGKGVSGAVSNGKATTSAKTTKATTSEEAE